MVLKGDQCTEEVEEELWSDNDDDGCAAVAAALGAACPPDDFEIVSESFLRGVTKRKELNKLVGQTIVYAWGDDTSFMYLSLIHSKPQLLLSLSFLRNKLFKLELYELDKSIFTIIIMEREALFNSSLINSKTLLLL